MRKHSLFGRTLALLMAVILCLSCLPLSALAAEAGEGYAPSDEEILEEVSEESKQEEPSESSEAILQPQDDSEGEDQGEENTPPEQEVELHNEEEGESVVLGDGEDTPKATPVSIQEALAGAEGTQFTVKGVVTLVDGQNYYLQDSTGGICLRLAVSSDEIALGDTIIGTGSKTIYNGLPQLGQGTFEKSEGLTLTAKDTTIGALTTGDLCTYVRIPDLTVTEVSGTTIIVSDGTNSIDIFKAATGDTKVKKDDVLTFTGAVGIYNSTLQLRNTNAGEIQVTVAAPEPEPDYRTWSQVALADIQNTDTIAITMTKDGTTWVLPSVGEGSKKQPLATYTGTIDGTTMTTDGYETFGWSITAVEGGYHIKNGEKYLYVTANNNGVRIGNTAAVWSVDNNYLMAKDSKDASRYLGVYNKTDWRCYKSINEQIAGQTLSFWKLGGASQPVKQTVQTPTASVESGDVPVGETVALSCATEGATILYKLGDGEYTSYSAPIQINENTILTVKATKDGMNDSAEAAFTYRAYKMVTKYVPANTIADGDEVVIYNAGNTAALSSTLLNKYYLTPVTVEAKDGVVETEDATLVWTVAANEDGSFTFCQGEMILGMNEGVNSKGKTVYNLAVADAANTKWDLTVCNAENKSYYLSVNGVTGSYGKVYIEYYAAYTEFSAYCTGEKNLTEKVFGFQFCKATEEKVYLDQPTEPDPAPKPEEPTAKTIKEALDLELGTQVTVKGVVTLVDNMNYYIQDATGGICLHLDAKAEDIALGDTIIATGTRAEYKGLPQLSKGTYEKSTGLELSAKKTTVDALTVADVCTYVELTGLEITEIYDNGGAWENPNITLTDGTNTIQLYKAVVTKTEGVYDLKVGDKVDIKAAVGIYTTTLQLRNTLPEEVTLSKTADSATLEDGKYVIWATAYNKALSANYSGYYNKGVDVALEGTTLTGYGASEVWLLTNQEDGTITLSHEGQNLAMGTDYTSMPLGEVNDRWVLEDAGDGQWFVKNVTRGAYIEWQSDKSSWSGYAYKNETNQDLFKLTFTPAQTLQVADTSIEEAIAQWGGNPNPANTTAVPGDRYEIGDEKDENAAFTAVVSGAGVQPYSSTTSSTGGTTYYMGGKGIGSGTDDYLQLAVNTAGWGDMTLRFRLRASNTSAGSFLLQYSTDGGSTFTSFTTGSAAYSWQKYENGTLVDSGTSHAAITDGVAKTSLNPGKYVEFTFDVPAGASDCKNLLIRLVPGALSAKGDKAPSASGVVRMDTVVLKGSPLVSEDITGFVTADPDGKEDQAVGTQLTLTSSTEGAAIFFRVNGGAWQTYGDTNKPVLTSLPCNVEAYATSDGKQDSVVRLFHYSAGTVSNVKITPNGGGIWVPSDTAPVEVTLSTATQGATIYYALSDAEGNFPMDGEGKEAWTVYDPEKPIALAKGFGALSIKAYAVKDGFTDSGVTLRDFKERASGTYNIYFGQLHSHTNISDGSGSIQDAYENGVKYLDFLAVTDHSNSFDNADSGALNVDGTSVSSEWAQAKAAAAGATTETFVGLYGYEMTWSNGLGHINTYNTPGWQSRTQTEYKTYATALQNYYNTLTTVPNSISQFNHPGTTFGDFSDFAYYTEAYDDLITLIEVGNGEGEVGSSGYFPSYEYYTRALDKGWHVAPTNNQDNHKGRWGNANTARSVVLADSLSEADIYDAMRNYRVYATEDNDLNLYYTLDGNIMGSILSGTDVGETVNLTLRLADATDSLDGTTVYVIVNGGKTAASYTIQSKARAISWDEEVTISVPADYNYYYLKVVQPDGDIAVTAPVWIGAVEAVGIASLTAESELTVVNEPQNFTLELYNNEKKPLDITSITYYLVANKGKTDAEGNSLEVLTPIGEDSGEGKITAVPKLSTATATFSHTFDTDGMYVVRAVVKGTLNGMEKVYTQDLEVTVVPKSITSTVIVDGTHFNDYVSGYYGGNVNNMVSLAASQSIKVHVETKQITKEMLEECSLLIVSAPARKKGESTTGSYEARPFEEEFLTLVKEYVEGGGSLIVCGLADYQDKGATYGADGHAAAQLNKLLEACGSTMKINDDEVYDTENNGGQAYRLYPTNFNTESKWTEGLVEGQQYSQYSGCSVNPGKGTWLVRGFDTTCSVDSDKDGVGNSEETLTDGTYSYNIVTPKGEVVFLAAEDTGKGGTIFAAGGVFVSDFEVKAELDNIWDLPYANRTIYENILGLTRTTPQITPIEQVRKSTKGGTELGKIFVIEGYVTAGTANEDTKFFDAIYVQDETGGITVFPYALPGLKLGTKMRITGYTDAYQGDIEIQILNSEIIGGDTKVYAPKKLGAKDAMDYNAHGGELIQVEGKVTQVQMENGVVSQFLVEDDQGYEAKVFIDGYIRSGTTGKNTLHERIVKVGNTVSTVGLLYLHPEGSSDVSVPVLRVRDCDEVVLKKTAEEPAFEISLIVEGQGKAEVDKTSAKAGEKVTITTDAKKGYGVLEIRLTDNIKVTKGKKGTYTFTQPAKNVQVTVVFAKTYNVEVEESDYGKITVSNEHPFEDEIVTITVKPNSGRGINSVKVLDEDGNRVRVSKKDGEYTFKQPDSDVTVKVTFKRSSAKTGDTSHVYLYVTIMVVAAVALAVLLLGRKKWFKR